MNYFIKKNIIFVIVCSITLIASIFLIYLDLAKHSEIVAANEVTLKNQQDHDNAYRKGNKPVELNIEMIKKDTETLRNKTEELQRIFGKPYRKAMQNFAKNLNYSENELYAIFKELYQNPDEQNKTAENLVSKLFKKMEEDKAKNLTKEKIEDALHKFIAEVQKNTVEDLTYESGRAILASALGLQRNMNAAMTHVYLTQMQNNFYKQRLIPGVKTLQEVQDFTFNQFTQTLPSGDAIPDILNTMPIFEDIFFRMKNAKLTSVDKFSRSKPVILSDKYDSYEFKMDITGSLESIRTFINDLQNAYLANRVYVITWIAIEAKKSTDEVDSIRKQLMGEENANDQNRNIMNNDRFGRQQRNRNVNNNNTNSRKRNRKARQQLDQAEIEMQSSYGKTVIGIEKNVNATVEFKYYVFTGDWLKPE